MPDPTPSEIFSGPRDEAFAGAIDEAWPAPSDLAVEIAGPREYHVRWSPPDGALGTALLERSESPSGPWEPVLRTAAGEAIDSPAAGDAYNREWFYRARYGPVSGDLPTPLQGGEGDVLVAGPSSLGQRFDALSPSDRQAVHASWLARRQMARIGEPAMLVPKLTSGERCPKCWNAERQVRERSSCTTCSSTGFVGGAPAPIPIRMSFGKDEPSAQPTQAAKSVLLQVPAWTSNYPRIKPGDFVVRLSDRKVLEVMEWRPTRFRSYVVRQNIITRMVDRGASAHALAQIPAT